MSPRASTCRAADAHGSPADTSEELAAAPEVARMAADRVLASALHLVVTPATVPGADCAPADLDEGRSWWRRRSAE